MSDTVKIDDELIDRLTIGTEPYLSCDDCFDETDAAVEAVIGRDEAFSEPFRVHLLACPACHDEARSLAELVAADFGLTPAEALSRIERALAPHA